MLFTYWLSSSACRPGCIQPSSPLSSRHFILPSSGPSASKAVPRSRWRPRPHPSTRAPRCRGAPTESVSDEMGATRWEKRKKKNNGRQLQLPPRITKTTTTTTTVTLHTPNYDFFVCRHHLSGRFVRMLRHPLLVARIKQRANTACQKKI